MKYSLKDLLWSVTFAGCGLATMSFGISADMGAKSMAGDMLMRWCFIALSMSFFGAAIGKLFHRTRIGALVGGMAIVLLVLGWLVWARI